MTGRTVLLILTHVALIGLSPTVGCRLLENTNIILAGRIAIEEGETLFLNCTLPSTAVECFNVADIRCRLKGSKFRVVDKVFVLSQGTAQLWLQIVTGNKSGGFSCSIPNAKRSDLSSCDNRSFIVNGRLLVHRRPLKPVISRCVVRNWTRVQCWWSPTQERQLQNGYLTNWRFLDQSLSLQSHENSSQWRWMCSNSGDETCDWSLNDDQSSTSSIGRSMCVQVTATNAVLPKKTVISDPYCFKFEDTVILDPPTNVSVVVTASDASLKWFSPFVDPGYKDHLLYKIRYLSEWQDESGWLEIISSASNVLLRSLHPNTVYRLSIQAATSVGQLWSQHLTASFRTSPSVPCNQPKISSSGFFIRSSNETHRNVTLYWKAIPKSDECGPGLYYEVNASSTNGEYFSYELEDKTSIDVVLSNSEVTVQVFARNDFGFASQPPTSIAIPTWESTMNQEETEEALQVTLEGNQSTVTVHWNQSIQQVVIYWCQRHPDSDHLCRDEIQWSDRPSADGQFELSLAGHFHSYLIGLAVNSDNRRTSGIHWFKCIYDLEKALNPPQTIGVKAPIDATDRLLVTWNLSQCHEDRHSKSSFLLVYCLYTNGSCSESRAEELSPGAMGYDLTGLEENTMYQVWIESKSEQSSRSRISSKELARTKAAREPVLIPGAIGGLVVGCIIFAVAGLMILLVLLRKLLRDSLCLREINIILPTEPTYSGKQSRSVTCQCPVCITDYTRISPSHVVNALPKIWNPLTFDMLKVDNVMDSQKTWASLQSLYAYGCTDDNGWAFGEPPDEEAKSPLMYGGSEFYGNPSESQRQQSKFLDDNNNDEMQFAGDSSHQRPSAITAKEQDSQVKVHKFPLKSESHLRAHQSECESLLTAELKISSDRISNLQPGWPMSVLPALTNEAGRIQPSCNRSCGSEQLCDTDNQSSYECAQCTSTQRKVKPTQINNTEDSSLKSTNDHSMHILPQIIHNTNSEQTAIDTNTIVSASLKKSHEVCSAEVTAAQPRTSKQTYNPENRAQREEVVIGVAKPENCGVFTHFMKVRNPLQPGQTSILPPLCPQSETITSHTEDSNAVPQTWKNLNSTSDDEYTSGRIISFSNPANEATTVHQNCVNSTFTSDDVYTSGQVNYFACPTHTARAVPPNCANSTFTSDDGYTSGQINSAS